MTNFAEMNKSELRAACKAAGISYGKLNNDGMRAALEAAAAPVTPDYAVTSVNGTVFCDCPACGVSLDNGVLHCDDEAMEQHGAFATSRKDGKTMRETGDMTQEFECMGCGEQFGEHVAPVQKAVDRHNGNGLKIEKNREERNGVKRPSIGGKCRAVWDALDELQSELEGDEQVTAKMVKDLAADEGWNLNNASQEFYAWRKFNGVTGRSK